jgi:hypothetical protein
MRRLFAFIISISLITSLATPVFAVTPSVKPTGSTSNEKVTPEPQTTSEEKQKSLIDQINNLKEKVASKVAELRLVEKRGIIGVVTQASDNKITMNDVNGETRYVDVDELTKFSSPDEKGAFGISDINKGMQLSVIGLYNKDSKRILARFVDVVSLPFYVSGQISAIDKVNFTITVVNAEQNKALVDIENVTKISTSTEADGLTKIGFSKLATGDRVYIFGYANKDDKKRLTATRIIVFSDLTKNPKIVMPNTQNESTPEASTSPTGTTKAKPTAKP